MLKQSLFILFSITVTTNASDISQNVPSLPPFSFTPEASLSEWHTDDEPAHLRNKPKVVHRKHRPTARCAHMKELMQRYSAEPFHCSAIPVGSSAWDTDSDDELPEGYRTKHGNHTYSENTPRMSGTQFFQRYENAIAKEEKKKEAKKTALQLASSWKKNSNYKKPSTLLLMR